MRGCVAVVAAATVTLCLAACADSGRPGAPSPSPVGAISSSAPSIACPSSPAPVPRKDGLQDQFDALVRALPDHDLITAATVGHDIPPGAAASGTGAWASLVSDAHDDVSQFRVRWESEIAIAALWKEFGESNAVVSGGDLDFTVRDSEGADQGFHYGFADNAKNYLFTDSKDHPAQLTADPTDLCTRIRAGARRMHVTLTSISIFGVLGADVAVVAQAPSLDVVDTSAGPFGDYTNLEGAYFELTDPDGHELASWSYSTGFLAGHGGLQPGDAIRPRPLTSTSP